MYAMLFIFSVIVAILYNSGAGYIANTKVAQKYSGNYAGRVGTMAVTFFLVLLVAGLLMNVVSDRSPLKA